MLEVRTAGAVPQFPAVLLMGPPVAFDGEGLPALAAHERLGAVLPLVVGLEGPEIFERLGSWVVDVVLTALRTAVAWQPKHRCWLCALQRVWALSIFRSVSPHMHLHVVVPIEGLAANGTSELHGPHEDLSWCRDPKPALRIEAGVPMEQVPLVNRFLDQELIKAMLALLKIVAIAAVHATEWQSNVQPHSNVRCSQLSDPMLSLSSLSDNRDLFFIAFLLLQRLCLGKLAQERQALDGLTEEALFLLLLLVE